MIIDNLDFGGSHPWLKPSSGQIMGSAVVEGAQTIVWPRAATERRLTVSFMAKQWQAIGGQAAGTQAALKLLLRQGEELAGNRDLQPVYIQWAATADPAGTNATDSHDGWYVLETFEPDYENYVVSGLVKVRMTVSYVASAPPQSLAQWYSGGALATNYSGASQIAIGYPVGAANQAATAVSRTGGEGAIPLSVAPSLNPLPFTPGTIAQLYQGGCHVYDTVIPGGNPVPTISTADLFHSIGTEALGTLAAWTGIFGTLPAIASNTITFDGSNQVIVAGHADWGDLTFTTRFSFAGAGAMLIGCHSDGTITNVIRANISANSLLLQKIIAGGIATNVAVSAPTLPAGTYWIILNAAGTTYTATLYADSAGTRGAAIAGASVSGTITDAGVQTGKVYLQEISGSGTVGGAGFANTCYVTGPVPTGWTPMPNNTSNGWAAAKEPAFCWSNKKAYSGTYSLSIYQPIASSPQSSWQGPSVAITGTQQWGVQYQSGANDTVTINDFGVTAVATATGAQAAFTALSASYTKTATVNVGLAASTGAGGGGTVYFDAATIFQGSTAVQVNDFEIFTGGGWVEVFGADHDFQGDCIVTNGLHLYRFQTGAAQACSCYLWNTAQSTPGWQQFATLNVADSATNGGTLRSFSLTRVGPEEARLVARVSTIGVGLAEQVALRLSRAMYFARTDFTPLAQANTNGYALQLTASSNLKIAYNSTKATDMSGGGVIADALGVPTDYGYGAAYTNNSGQPFVLGMLWQSPPATNQPSLSNQAGLGMGDNALPTQNATRSYGIFAIPYGTPTTTTDKLQAEAESGALGTGWSSVADAAASGGNAAKCASGTVVGNAATWGTSFIPSAGVYDLWVRMKVTSNTASTAQMQVGLWDATSSAFVASSTYAPNALTTSYAWYRVAASVIPTATHNMQVRAVSSTNTLTTDFFMDESSLNPLTLSGANTGPQEIFQQFLHDRTVRLVRQ